MKKKEKNILNSFLPLITVIVLLAIWETVALSVDSEYVLPTLEKTLTDMTLILKSGNFYLSLLYTLLRSLISFVCSFILSFCLAYLSFMSEKMKALFSPLVAITRALPTIAIVLLLLFWTTSEIAPMIVTALVVFPTCYNEILNGFNGIDKSQIEMCKVDRIKEMRILFRVEIPQMLPSLLTTVGTGISLNIKLMVAAEVLSQTATSIGYMLNTAKVYFEVSNMIALVVVVVVLCVIIEAVFNFFSKKANSFRE